MGNLTGTGLIGGVFAKRPTLAQIGAEAEKTDDPERIAYLGGQFIGLLLAGDRAAARAYRHHQERALGPDPLAEGACEWPGELAGETPTVLDVPRTAPLLGWRMWAVRGVDLVAPFVHTSWDVDHRHPGTCWRAGVNRVSTTWCRNTGHHPAADCRCGIRAVQSLTVLSAFAKSVGPTTGPPGAVARVAVWGRVATYAPDDWGHTLRAEYAQIVGPIDLAPEHEPRRAAIEARYRIVKGGGTLGPAE